MAEPLTNDELCQTALAALEEELGPVDALRFVALVRREPFDYQAWREKSLAGMSIDELFQRLQQVEAR
jgi:hypothetical protein